MARKPGPPPIAVGDVIGLATITKIYMVQMDGRQRLKYDFECAGQYDPKLAQYCVRHVVRAHYHPATKHPGRIKSCGCLRRARYMDSGYRKKQHMALLPSEIKFAEQARDAQKYMALMSRGGDGGGGWLGFDLRRS